MALEPLVEMIEAEDMCFRTQLKLLIASLIKHKSDMGKKYYTYSFRKSKKLHVQKRRKNALTCKSKP